LFEPGYHPSVNPTGIRELIVPVWRVAALVAWLCALGCAAPAIPAANAPPPPNPGDPNAAPSLAALPDLPEGTSGNTPRTHQGVLLARQTLAAVIPTPPNDRSYASLQRWIDSVVVAWIEQRRAAAEATRDRFLLEANPSRSELAVTHAVVGLIDEDTALALQSLPTPAELYSEPDIAAMYRDILRTQARTFTSSAVNEFRDCANIGYQAPADMQSWARFCHARFDRLQPVPTRTPAPARVPQ
jgi:hypothetical protein